MAFHLLAYVVLFFMAISGVHVLTYRPVERQPCDKQTSAYACSEANAYCAWCRSARRCVEWNPCTNSTAKPGISNCLGEWIVFPTPHSWRHCHFLDEKIIQLGVFIVCTFGSCIAMWLLFTCFIYWCDGRRYGSSAARGGGGGGGSDGLTTQYQALPVKAV